MEKIIQIKLNGAKQIIQSKLQESLEGKACWLSAYDQVADWFEDNKQKGLLLMGGQGVGKSFLCREVIVPIIKSREYGIWKNVISVTPFDIGKKLENITNTKCPVYFDDFGIETPYTVYGNTVDPLVQLTFYAEPCGQLLILTTNMTDNAIIERYGHRVFDRLNYLCRRIEFKAMSFR